MLENELNATRMSETLRQKAVEFQDIATILISAAQVIDDLLSAFRAEVEDNNEQAAIIRRLVSQPSKQGDKGFSEMETK